jgi:predicted transcriptional regulator
MPYMVYYTPMTPTQCRMGRAALGWSMGDLAEYASVSINTIQRFEQGDDARVSSVAKMRAAMEQREIRFTFANDGTEGVQIRSSAR